MAASASSRRPASANGLTRLRCASRAFGLCARIWLKLVLWLSIDRRYKDLRQDMRSLRQEMRTDIGTLHSRIDVIYQALFSHKDPAA